MSEAPVRHGTGQDPASRAAIEAAGAVGEYLARGGPLSVADGSGVIGELEGLLCGLLGVKNALTFSAGTAALHCGYLALDLEPGAEVIAPVLGFHAAVTPALHCGLSPVLVDVDPASGTMSPAALRAAITGRTRCVTVVHYLGHPAEMDEITAICREHGLALAEDCSHAYLSAYRGQPVGTFGDFAAWSMHETKTLPAGEGGFLATPHRRILDRALLAGHYRGRAHTQVTDPGLREFAETGLGLKYRLHPLAAVIALARAATLRSRVESRQRLLTRLSAALETVPGIAPPTVAGHVSMGGWFSYRPAAPSLEGAGLTRLLESLRAAGVPAHEPSVGPLDALPLLAGPAPLRAATATWRPRLCGPFDGARAYQRGRLSVTVRDGDTPALMDGYASAFAAAAREAA
ncbi:MAG: DegT/DnrJ/EryC1/StrS family aminotransferase [Trebonia sp.]